MPVRAEQSPSQEPVPGSRPRKASHAAHLSAAEAGPSPVASALSRLGGSVGVGSSVRALRAAGRGVPWGGGRRLSPLPKGAAPPTVAVSRGRTCVEAGPHRSVSTDRLRPSGADVTPVLFAVRSGAARRGCRAPPRTERAGLALCRPTAGLRLVLGLLGVAVGWAAAASGAGTPWRLGASEAPWSVRPTWGSS